ncbi:MAG TPA: hypothetical protein VKV28_04810 [Candidatus Binataceae bacterium]|nr:hypothetical protein [Candidatus Binataceae bacterium]
MNSQEFLLLALHHLVRQRGGREGGGAPAAPAAVGALGAAQALARGMRGHSAQRGLNGLGGVVSGRGMGGAGAVQAGPAAGLVMGMLGHGAGRGRLVPPSRRARRHRVTRPAHLMSPAAAGATALLAIPALPVGQAPYRWLPPPVLGRYRGLGRLRLPQGWLDG